MSARAINRSGFSGCMTAVLDELPFYEEWGGGAFTKPAGSGGPCKCIGVVAALDERGVGGTEAHGRVWLKCFA